MGSLLGGKLGVDVLDAAAVMAAAVQRDFSTASSIMTLLHISELLEDYTRKKARQTLSQSLAINIDGVWLVGNTSDSFAPISSIRVGDKIRVRTGHVIPLDGEVVSGEALVNESSMTGEPLGVLRSVQHSVYAGTVVEDGSLIIRVRTLADNTRIQNIVSLIEQSEELKAAIQSRAEKLADSIVPLSFLASITTLLITRNITKAMSVLMVDYSCAIKLTTPICVISAMHEAAKLGILVKGGKYLEAYADTDTIVFDKTGTLTSACPEARKVIPFGGRLAGMICVHDPVKPEAGRTLTELRNLGIKRFIMITGDSEAAAVSVCAAIGIDEYYAQTLPEKKAEIMKELKRKYGKVIMVGDGVNDAPALSCADVSVAMRDGSDIAKEVADITLNYENLSGLVSLRRLSMALFERINSNYRFVLGFNSSLLLLGIGGIIAPSSSALMHNISTMTLAATSTRPYLVDADKAHSTDADRL